MWTRGTSYKYVGHSSTSTNVNAYQAELKVVPALNKPVCSGNEKTMECTYSGGK